ncbi:MAG TPA: S41 family peptidase [Flavisolibacter sp.]
MKKALLHSCFLLICFNLTAQELTGRQYREDFEFFWKTVQENYCYWDKKQTDWQKVKTRFSPMMDTVSSRRSFVLLLEKVMNELYDHHASLNTNTRESQRLVPSGTDIWAKYVKGKPVITEVRRGFGADKAGMKAGMEIIAVNDVPVATAILPYLPASLKKEDDEARNYALRLLLAGKFIDDRKIRVRDGNAEKDFFPDRPAALLLEHRYEGSIESSILEGNIGYIRINNRLWDNDIIPLFDSVLKSLQHTKALVLDLRETPGGGNTTVARSIMGSFIRKEGFYQKHELTAEETAYGIKRSWVEIVSPRKWIYTKPLVILVNHWTGSVGEGITIGFDALRRARITGTEMARLNGAVYSFRMPHTNIGFTFPGEKLFHVNGTPREEFQPSLTINLEKQKPGTDFILQQALNGLRNRK